jgi:hypothetical protein
VRGKGSRGGWRHKEGEYGFGRGDSFIWVWSRGDFGEELGGTDLAVRICCAYRG